MNNAENMVVIQDLKKSFTGIMAEIIKKNIKYHLRKRYFVDIVLNIKYIITIYKFFFILVTVP